MTTWLARLLLWAYPPRFRRRYSGPIRQLMLDAAHDPASAPPRFWLRLLPDLLLNAIKEDLLMLVDREKFLSQSVSFQSVMLAAMLSIFSLMLYVGLQQVFRRDANEPQIQMTQSAVTLLENGAPPAQAVALFRGTIPLRDVEQTLAPFAVVYDAQGRPIEGSAQYQGHLPSPPPGVFDYARAHGMDKFTWQPRPGLRIAAVLRPVADGAGGFVLSGRSLQLAERDISNMGSLVLVGWGISMALLAVGTIVFLRCRPSITV